MKKIFFIFWTAAAISATAQKQVTAPLPAKQQLAWHEMEFYFFIHFGPNTFTDKEWGHGDEPEDIFNPSQLDCRQWARIAKQAGAKGIIITAKHHDGFCLWPSNYSKHTVRESRWKDGKGDVLRELSQACKEYGLKFGVYISPWDRNHPDYGTPKYNDVFASMMKEIFQNYGPVWELWWDGANGEGPNGKKQVYDWDKFKRTVRQLSPKTVVFSDVGPHIRWVGNENGIAGKTNWNTLDTAGFTPGIGAPHVDTLNRGNVNGKVWIPAECDVSIRPGWFYHAAEDSKVKTPEQLFDLYLKSVGRGANLLLNIPPDRRGLIHENDSAALITFKQLRDKNFANNLAKNARAYWQFTVNDLPERELIIQSFGGNKEGYSINLQQFTVEFTQPTKTNCIVLYEYIKKGQTIRNFKIDMFSGTNKVGSVTGTTVGRKRILTFPTAEITSFKVYLDDKNKKDNIRAVTAHLIDEQLTEK